MKKKICYPAILVVIILICLFRITWAFVYEKEGFHCDEPWSYGFANSEYEPFIYSYDTNILKTADNPKNVNEWVTAEVFKRYLVVDEGEQFHFDSVIYNKSGDMSPSLYELILHFVCSLFPNTFSWWYAFVINAACYILMLVLVCKICDSLQKNRMVSLIVTAFFGLSYGTFNTILYFRMYAMLSLFTLLTMYLFQKINASEKTKLPLHIFLILTVFGGAFTHFYYLLFAFFLTGFCCILFLCQKKIGKCFILAGTMLIGVIIFFAIYPAALGMILSSEGFYDHTLSYPYKISLGVFLNLFSLDTLGVKWFIDRYLLLDIFAGLVFVVIITVLLLFLFRNENWYGKFKGGVIKVLLSVKSVFLGFVKAFSAPGNNVIIATILSVGCSLAVIAKISNVAIMGIYADRYTFYLYPVFIIAVFVPLFSAMNKKSRGAIVYSVLLVMLTIASLGSQQIYIANSQYLFSRGDNKQNLSELFYDNDVIIISDNYSRLEWYDVFLMNAKRALMCKEEDILKYAEAFNDLSEDRTVYLVFEQGKGILNDENWSDKNIIDALCEVNPAFENVEFAFSQNTYFGTIDIYRLGAE